MTYVTTPPSLVLARNRAKYLSASPKIRRLGDTVRCTRSVTSWYYMGPEPRQFTVLSTSVACGVAVKYRARVRANTAGALHGRRMRMAVSWRAAA